MTTENLICTMTGDQYRGAFECRAVDDVRYYINGIHLCRRSCIAKDDDAYNGDVVSTNGHLMFVSPIRFADDICEGFGVIFEPAKIKAGAVTVNIYTLPGTVDGFNQVEIEAITKKGVAERFVRNVIDGRFPDYTAVMPRRATDKDRGPGHTFGFDSTYLLTISKVFKKGYTHIEMRSNNSAAWVYEVGRPCKADLPHQTGVALMPLRV